MSTTLLIRLLALIVIVHKFNYENRLQIITHHILQYIGLKV